MKTLLSVMLALALFLPMVSCGHPTEAGAPWSGGPACSQRTAAAEIG